MTTENETTAFFWLRPVASSTAVGGLRQAADEGVLSPDDYAKTVTGCQSCSTPEVCRSWLAANDLPPDACGNAPLIRELRAL